MLEDRFNDPNFIPDDAFCDALDDDSPFNVLKFTFDGNPFNNFLRKKSVDYLALLKKTGNFFLKLVCFNCLKLDLSTEEQLKLLNTENLIPLFYEVALNIVRKCNRRYRPWWLIKEYIKISHKSSNPRISIQEMIDNVGNLLQLIKNDEHQTHLEDIFFILRELLGVKKKILNQAINYEKLFLIIDHWINEVFDGNLSRYDNTKILLDKIFDFYENQCKSIEVGIIQKKYVIFSRYKLFYDKQFENDGLIANDIQSILVHEQYGDMMLEITKKYCVNEKIKDKLIRDLKQKTVLLNENIPNALNKMPVIEGSNLFSINMDVLKPFENDDACEFVRKISQEECFIPNVPDTSFGEDEMTRFIPTTLIDNDKRRTYKAGNPLLSKSFKYKTEIMEYLHYLKLKLHEYETLDFLGAVYSIVHFSRAIDGLTKKIFFVSLNHYQNRDYFRFLQVSLFQIERVLKSLCKKHHIACLFKNEDKTVPKGLEHMIRELKNKNVLSYKLAFFLEWLLIDTAEIECENIRNKIAHGIDDEKQFREIYTQDNALSIILIYLFLSRD